MATKEAVISINIEAWRHQPLDVAKENLASELQEYQKIPDPYYFSIGSSGKLLDPRTKIPIQKFIAARNLIEEREYQAFLKIQEWARDNGSGAILWISPPNHKSGYFCSKFTISELRKKNGEKQLHNTAILNFEDAQNCLEIARKILPSLVVTDPEVLRATPIPITPPDGVIWTSFLEKHIPPRNAWIQIKNLEHETKKQKAREIAEKASRMVKENNKEKEIKIKVVLDSGEERDESSYSFSNFYSCPPGNSIFTPGSVFLEYSRVFRDIGKFVKKCGACGKEINKIIKLGYKCSCGGMYKGC